MSLAIFRATFIASSSWKGSISPSSYILKPICGSGKITQTWKSLSTFFWLATGLIVIGAACCTTGHCGPSAQAGLRTTLTPPRSCISASPSSFFVIPCHSEMRTFSTLPISSGSMPERSNNSAILPSLDFASCSLKGSLIYLSPMNPAPVGDSIRRDVISITR